MQNGEKLIAVESIIFQFAQSQFAANNISPLEARLIMEAVDGKFQKISLETVLMGMVQMVDPNEQQPPRDEAHTGTVEDLKEAFSKTGFVPDEGKGAKKK